MKFINKLLPGALAAIVLSACTGMPHQKVEGLPPLKVSEHVVEPGEIFTHCKEVMTWLHWATLSFPLACARISFEQNTCDIYVAGNTAPETVEHERLHCQGFDHGTSIQAAYDAWRAEHQKTEIATVPEGAKLAEGRKSGRSTPNFQ